VISPGTAWRLPFEALDAQGPGRGLLRRLLHRFAYVSMIVTACRLACNSEHNIDQRLARWLLWVHDETARPEISITHQQLADIAAIRRPSVSLALSAFQREGLVKSQHGRLQVLGRERLEQIVCPCYALIRSNVENVSDVALQEQM
ncbi:MAG: winged helix-turn-helix domain-containing protein, partial [Candidatus Eremiobacteraeota bacterium]|nr:winged helix-turn-helix domain-containing protein [Candidatus Eremiobacteraeota bacterium]